MADPVFELREKLSHQEAIRRFHVDRLGDQGQRDLKKATEALTSAQDRYDYVMQQITDAPMKIEECDRQIAILKKRLHEISVLPDLERLIKLQAEVARLEAQIYSK